MKTLVRWNPNSLLNEFDRLMEREITEPRHNLTIALDVAETEDDYKVMAAIPGVNADEIDITIEADVLNVLPKRLRGNDITFGSVGMVLTAAAYVSQRPLNPMRSKPAISMVF